MKFAAVIKRQELHDQNDETNNPLSFSESVYEGHDQKHQTFVSQIVNILP